MKKWIIIISSLLVVVVLCGVLFMSKSSLTARASEVEKKTIEVIQNVKRTPSIYSSFPNLETDKDAFSEAYKLGPASVPFLIDYVIESEDNGFNEAFIIMAAANNLHLHYLPGMVMVNGTKSVYSKEEGAYGPKWYAKKLKEFASDAPAQVEKICNLDISFEEKQKKLMEYGMLAVPVLCDKIKDGDEQWKETVQAITLWGLNEEQRIETLTESYTQRVSYEKDVFGAVLDIRKKAVADKEFSFDIMEKNETDLKILSELYN